MTTWTLEHAKAIVAAWPEVEFRLRGSTWARPTGQLSNYGTCSLGSPEEFRLPPKKKLVEWTAEDVKPGMVFRWKEWKPGTWRYPHEIGLNGIIWDNDRESTASWETLAKQWLWSIDASPGSWRPCAKEVDQ